MVTPINKSLRSSIRRQSRSLLETGSRFKSFDQVRQRHFWSDYLFTPDANGYVASGQNYTVFTTPQGQSGQGFPTALTDLQTNFKGAARVPDNQNLQITEIGVSLVSVPVANQGSGDIAQKGQINPQDHSSFVNNTVVGITYLTNTVELGLAADFPQASAPSSGIFAVGTTANQGLSLSNGFAAPGLRRVLKVPILIGHGETFNFVFIIPRTFAITPNTHLCARLDVWATESFVEKS